MKFPKRDQFPSFFQAKTVSKKYIIHSLKGYKNDNGKKCRKCIQQIFHACIPWGRNSVREIRRVLKIDKRSPLQEGSSLRIYLSRNFQSQEFKTHLSNLNIPGTVQTCMHPCVCKYGTAKICGYIYHPRIQIFWVRIPVPLIANCLTCDKSFNFFCHNTHMWGMRTIKYTQFIISIE